MEMKPPCTTAVVDGDTGPSVKTFLTLTCLVCHVFYPIGIFLYTLLSSPSATKNCGLVTCMPQPWEMHFAPSVIIANLQFKHSVPTLKTKTLPLMTP